MKPQTTNPSIQMSNNIDLLNLPFIEALKRLLKDAVKDCLAEVGMLTAHADTPAKTAKRDPNGLKVDEAVRFLNENGFAIKKGQIYKETSNGTIPFKKFGNKLHFKEEELLAWAEGRLIDGNAVGILQPVVPNTKRGGGR